MNANIALERFDLLPESIQLQVVDYIDFLLDKYLSEIEKGIDSNIEIDEETKKLLDQRVALHNSDPSKAQQWEKALETIAEKYNYEL
ncbi:MAG: hypothetical protein DRI95_04865 [Bacteroidetes bacterium]|nr:MAG: hypothetical protein DRI95_04865 [Bacteroidota bacterium]RLD82618.1 MAG: hypothetical protein DRJ07_07990 [Bacteroidota bacterium]